jgi:hypothetical protein
MPFTKSIAFRHSNQFLISAGTRVSCSIRLVLKVNLIDEDTVFLNAKPHYFVGGCKRFEGVCCLYLQSGIYSDSKAKKQQRSESDNGLVQPKCCSLKPALQVTESKSDGMGKGRKGGRRCLRNQFQMWSLNCVSFYFFVTEIENSCYYKTNLLTC